MMTVDVEELKRRAAAGEADNEETTLAQRLEDRLGMQQAERVRQLRERAESRASILGGFEDDDLVKVAELATAAAAWCATHDAAVEARRDYLFYRGILAGCAERDAAAVEAAFTTEGETTAAEAAQALRGLKDEAINDLLEAYREAKRTVNRAAAAYRAAQDGGTLAEIVKAGAEKICDTQAAQGKTLGRIDANAATAAGKVEAARKRGKKYRGEQLKDPENQKRRARQKADRDKWAAQVRRLMNRLSARGAAAIVAKRDGCPYMASYLADLVRKKPKGVE